MRAVFIATLTAIGLGLIGTSATLAAPANGVAIGKSTEVGNLVEQAHWKWRRYHHRRAVVVIRRW